MTCSTAAGAAIGGIAYAAGFTPPVCLVSAGLCSFAGMLPDIDSNTSRSFQECIYLAAGLGGILFIQRLRQFGLESDLIILGGVSAFLFVRFIGGTLIRKLTSHRGMIHSIPMAILSGELTFFLAAGTVSERLVKAAALMFGYLSHLVLDEICSIDSTGRVLRLKKSFGTALKWTDSKRKVPVLLLYTFVICLGYTMITHPEVVERLKPATAGQAVMAGETAPMVPVILPRVLPKVPVMPASETAQQAAAFLLRQTEAEPAKKYAAAASHKPQAELSLFSRSALPPTAAPPPEIPAAQPDVPISDNIMMDFQ